MKIIVIGSGMAGLTAAAYLARGGHQVTIFEQFDTPGGVTATVRQDGYGWDLGPLMLEGFGPGDKASLILAELGVADQVKTVRGDRGIAFPEFAVWKPREYAGPYWRRERLKQIFPTEAKSIERYYRFYDRMMLLSSLARQAEGLQGVPKLVTNLRLWATFQTLKRWVGRSSQDLMDYYFTSPELKTFFIGIVADFVTAPSEFPALGVPSIHNETAFDVRVPIRPNTQGSDFGYFYILGGCQKLVDAVLAAFTRAGGQLCTGRKVEKILVDESSGRACGVQLEGGQVEPADLVIATGGANETFGDLLGFERLPESMTQDLTQIRYMESVFMVHLGIDFDPQPYQPEALCYYYITTDLETSVERIRAGYYHEGEEGYLIYVPSKHSPDLAPPGHHAVTIYTVAPDRLNQGTWADRSEELADKLVALAEQHIPGLRAHTTTRLVMTPDDFRLRTHQKHHSFGGTPPVMGNKPPRHKTPIPGLWFIGSQSEGGGGVANVMLGGQKVAQLILAGQS